jgi:uncharacterized membrane protein
MDAIIGYILLAGVLLSAAFLIGGIFWRWKMTGNPDIHETLSGTNLFQFLTTNLRRAAAGDWNSGLFINLGIALLLVTPYIRVAASTVYFAAVERNIKYVVITGFVWMVLTYTLFFR